MASNRDLAKRLGIADLVKRLGFPGLGRAYDDSGQTNTEEKAEKLDRASDALLKGMEVWQDSETTIGQACPNYFAAQPNSPMSSPKTR